jgi:hypothetical protein
MTAFSDDYAEVMHDDVVERIANIVNGLRRLADRVERDGEIREASGVFPARHCAAVQRVQHHVTWDIANLGLDLLAEAAGRADRAEAIEEKPGE